MIYIDDKYGITADRFNYILMRKRKTEKGGEAWSTEGYCVSMIHAIDLIYRIETRQYAAENNSSLEDAVKEFVMIENKLAGLEKKIHNVECTGDNEYKCPCCGNALDAGTKYCCECGTKIGWKLLNKGDK